MLNANTTTSSSTATSTNTEDRTVIYTTSYDVTISDDGTVSWHSNDAAAFNIFRFFSFAAGLAAKLGTRSPKDWSGIFMGAVSRADIQLRNEKLELEEGYAYRSVGEVTFYSDGHIQARGSQCRRLNIFSLTTRLAGLACKLQNMARKWPQNMLRAASFGRRPGRCFL